MFARARRRGLSFLFGTVALLVVALPASAQDASPTGDSPTLSVTERLEDRRYVATGERAYVVGTEEGRFPAMGFHTRGEMGGVWSPPIKLLDGVWFGIDERWIGPAQRFTSGYGYVKMDLPGYEGLAVSRTDFVPDGSRAVLIGLTFEAGGADQKFTLKMDAHSELMGAYPWGETTPNQTEFNLEDTVAVRGSSLVFREEGTSPTENAQAHDWAAVVGSRLAPSDSETGEDFRGPQDPAEVCPPSPDEAPELCDDTAYGKGKGGQLRYDVEVPANSKRTVWFAVSGADSDGENPADAVAEALEEQEAVLRDPERLLEEKVSSRLELARSTDLDLPGDRRLQESIDWSKQNLADSVQAVEDLEIRETNSGAQYPEPEGTLGQARFLGAGFPDYQWLFGTDGEYVAFASVAVGQFGPIKDHLRALKEVSEIDNGGSGKVVHEVVTDGTVFFGSNADDGNTDETAKFPSAVALIWRWTGDDVFRDEMYGFTRKNMRYIFRELDEDGDGWPEGLGNVEREGMGEEKLDVAVYTIRGLYDLADMARSKGDEETAAWAQERAERMESEFEGAWWFAREGAAQYADSLRNPKDERVFQRHWIGATPMEVELVGEGEKAVLASPEHAEAALEERELDCYTDRFGMYHTGTGLTEAEGGNPGSSCDEHASEIPSERAVFTLNTAIMAVAEGNYGRLGEEQQRRYTAANADLQLLPDEQPGAMPEIAPSPDYEAGGSRDKPLNERAMVLQAWGAYGTVWPVVHQQLGVRPDLGRDKLELVPQVPPDSPGLSGSNIRLGDGSVAVSAEAGDGTYTTTVDPDLSLGTLALGHVLPPGKGISSVTLDGASVPYEVRETASGKEILVEASPGGEHELIVTTGVGTVADTGGFALPAVLMALAAGSLLAAGALGWVLLRPRI